MPVIAVLPYKGLVAHRAGEGLLSAVDPQMDRQIVVGGESLATNATRVHLAACVGPDVGLECGVRLEGERAEGAEEGACVRVGGLVAAQGLPCDEPLATHLTLVGPVIQVRHHVNLQVGLDAAALATHIAHKGLGSLMVLHVGGQRGLPGEGLAADGAHIRPLRGVHD